MRQLLEASIQQVEQMLGRLRHDQALAMPLDALVGRCVAALQAGGKVLFAGNGGSAADAQHWAAELVGRFAFDRPGLAAVALTTDTSALTAIANDYGYDHTFARQVEALGRSGDVFVGISTSGNSANVVRALEAAHRQGLTTAGFTGSSPGKMARLCDHLICVPAHATPVIQQGHALLGHVLCEGIERAMFARDRAGCG